MAPHSERTPPGCRTHNPPITKQAPEQIFCARHPACERPARHIPNLIGVRRARQGEGDPFTLTSSERRPEHAPKLAFMPPRLVLGESPWRSSGAQDPSGNSRSGQHPATRTARTPVSRDCRPGDLLPDGRVSASEKYQDTATESAKSGQRADISRGGILPPVARLR
jgi:hypothetical protein